MQIKTQEVVDCKKCGQTFAIREYFGMEGTWYTDNRDHTGDGECLVQRKLTQVPLSAFRKEPNETPIPTQASPTPETDAIRDTPLMGETVTPHKWDAMTDHARRLERERNVLLINLGGWHDRLGNMTDQVGHPDYSLRSMVEGLRELRDEMFAALSSVQGKGETPIPIDDGERCPQCGHDFALCNCYPEQP